MTTKVNDDFLYLYGSPSLVIGGVLQPQLSLGVHLVLFVHATNTWWIHNYRLWYEIYTYQMIEGGAPSLYTLRDWGIPCDVHQ